MDNNMPLNKEWFLNNIGEENIQSLVKHEMKSLQMGFENWLEENDFNAGDYTVAYWLENEVALDMNWSVSEYVDMTYDDILYRKLGVNYEHYKITYDQYYFMLNKRFEKFNLPNSLAHMLMWEVWKRLSKTLDFKLYNVL
jgi:hypothetical protein